MRMNPTTCGTLGLADFTEQHTLKVHPRRCVPFVLGTAGRTPRHGALSCVCPPACGKPSRSFLTLEIVNKADSRTCVQVCAWAPGSNACTEGRRASGPLGGSEAWPCSRRHTALSPSGDLSFKKRNISISTGQQFYHRGEPFATLDKRMLRKVSIGTHIIRSAIDIFVL